MVSRGTKNPYVQAIGASATGVTQSCYVVRFQKYMIMLDCGLYQESDIATNYKKNQELLKKIKPRDIDWLILHEAHIDHTGLVPALYARGCQAHILVPKGTTPFLKVLWEDSCKIMAQDALKLNNKHNIKASAFYTQDDINVALNRCIEVDVEIPYMLTENIKLTYFPSNHIINACQLSLEFKQSYQKKVLNFTGDIGGTTPQYYVKNRVDLPKCDIVLAENTYNTPKRMNKAYDRQKDLDKLSSILNEYRRVLIPVFALGRCQTMLTELYHLWKENKIPSDIKIYVDSPMAQNISKLFPDDGEWGDIMSSWNNFKFITEFSTSQAMQASNEPMVVLSSAGMMSGGRSVFWAKALIPDKNAHIVFCGYSSENTLASQIRFGQKEIMIDGDLVPNNCNITELVSYSSHASYEELMEYYGDTLKYNKIALVHGNFEYKVAFAEVLQNKLIKQGKSSRVIVTNADSKISF